jgi:hypothetical protein
MATATSEIDNGGAAEVMVELSWAVVEGFGGLTSAIMRSVMRQSCLRRILKDQTVSM